VFFSIIFKRFINTGLRYFINSKFHASLIVSLSINGLLQIQEHLWGTISQDFLLIFGADLSSNLSVTFYLLTLAMSL
jgi:hypothetical protein